QFLGGFQLTPERWQQVKELVAEALSVEAQERSRLLARVCSTDPALYQEVHQLLALENEADTFLESSPVVELDSKAKTLDSPSVTFQPKVESDSLAIGTTLLEKYTILKLIGQGGMARVYQARHIDLGIFVAVKVLKSAFTQDPSLFERFKREAQTAASLDHPNSVRVFDYGVQGTACYLVMEYLEGESLRQRLKARRRMPLGEVLVFLEQVCPALSYVHRKGVIHRDLKPDNIFFAHQDGKEIVKILDFGIAKPSTIAETLTNPDLICGTPHYMSPEQCVGDHITLSSDLYSLGVILYEMLAGVRPFEADATLTVMYAHVNLPVPELSQRCPEIPQSVSNLVARLMSKKPHDRFSSADEFLQA
ncbi:MAG TPA: serine/threonine-protein kinase, partial [Acidobacteriota bacterium]|nr:serine/threonine-protein kinase [Acidobacteriota bacterium]